MMDISGYIPNIFKGKLTDKSEIKCQECQVFYPVEQWEEVSIYCETCGDHAGIACPECGDNIDFTLEMNLEFRDRVE
jgi:hypothetical protein